jgi:hypothetical protein
VMGAQRVGEDSLQSRGQTAQHEMVRPDAGAWLMGTESSRGTPEWPHHHESYTNPPGLFMSI